MQFDLRRAVVHNWPMKVTSLAAAAVLWAVIAAKEPRSQLIPVTLNLQVPPGRALAEEPPRVEALVTGPTRELFKLFSNPPYIDLAIPDGPATTYQLELSPQNIRYGTNTAAVLVQGIEPRRISVRLDSVATKTVPIFPVATVTPDTGFQVVGDPTVTPSSIVVTGTIDALTAISGLSTVPFTRANARATVRTTIALDTSGIGTLRLSAYTVTLAAVVVEVTTRVLPNVRVVAIDADAGTVVVNPATVLVTIRGPADRVERMTADSVTVTVGSLAGDSTGTVLSVRAPAGIQATATPDRVTVRRVP